MIRFNFVNLINYGPKLKIKRLKQTKTDTISLYYIEYDIS